MTERNVHSADPPAADEPALTGRAARQSEQTGPAPRGAQGRGRLHLALRARVSIAAAIVAAVIVTVFAAQNTRSVDVNFLGWTSAKAPLFLLILAAAALGAIIAWLFSALRWRRRAATRRSGA